MSIWQRYKETFPRRYLELGNFDTALFGIIEQLRPGSALDIGGGQDGTLMLKAQSVPTYLLDPFVSKPSWVVEKVLWGCDKYFDLIVARGSINYLPPSAIESIPHRLTPRGVFLANTFKEPPSRQWTERPYENGIERVRSHQGIIEHELVTTSDTIAHTFFYYSPDDWTKLLPGVKLTTYGKNSLLLTLEKPNLVITTLRELGGEVI